MTDKKRRAPDPSATNASVPLEAHSAELEDAGAEERLRRILESPSYVRAYEDVDFLMRHDLRSVRLELELLKPELILRQHRIRSTIVVFGGTRIIEEKLARRRVEALEERLRDEGAKPELERELAVARRILAKSRYYEEAREFARIVSRTGQSRSSCSAPARRHASV